jgi:hypothetical protein
LINRRDAFRAMAIGTGVFAGLGPSGAAAGTIVGESSIIDFSKPEENLRAWARVLGHLDPAVETPSWYGGHIFAVRENKALVPLVGVEGFGVLRVQPQENGAYRLFNRELAFYKDPKTEKVVDTWRNPLTDEKVEVMPIHNRIVNAEVAAIQKMDMDGTMVEQPFNPPWWVWKDSAFSLFELHAAFPNPMTVDKWPRESAGPILRVSEMFQRMSPLAELEDLQRPSVDYVGTWTRVGPWLPWMLMGQAEGHMLYRTFMKKLGSLDELPKDLRKKAEKEYPDFFQAPGLDTWGQPNESSFGVYMSERQPAPPRKD